ncbi:MAG: hypothetical protein ACYC5M_17175, partial [Anaerolineae bacterium]
MNVVTRRGIYALLLILLVVTVTGCMPRGAAADPGWTAVAVDGNAVFSVLTNGRVVALDAQNGTEIWAYPVQQAASGGGGLGALFSGGNSDQAE